MEEKNLQEEITQTVTDQNNVNDAAMLEAMLQRKREIAPYSRAITCLCSGCGALLFALIELILLFVSSRSAAAAYAISTLPMLLCGASMIICTIFGIIALAHVSQSPKYKAVIGLSIGGFAASTISILMYVIPSIVFASVIY